MVSDEKGGYEKFQTNSVSDTFGEDIENANIMEKFPRMEITIEEEVRKKIQQQ